MMTVVARKPLPLTAYPYLTHLSTGPTKVSCAGAANRSTADKP